MFFLLIMVGIVAGNALWWRWADRRARSFRHPRIWRVAIAVFSLLQYAYLALFFFAPTVSRRSHLWMPAAAIGAFYLWNLLVLPFSLVINGIISFVRRTWRWASVRRAPMTWDASDSPRESASPTADVMLTRRQWLSATAVALPPLVTGGLTARGMVQLGELRIREIDVPIRDLPDPLDGLKIAHITDTHIGRFTRRANISGIVEATNSLRADLVAFTGDLIDLSLADFPAAAELIHRLDPRSGLVMVEGNHDLIENPNEFVRLSRAANLPLLLDEARTIHVRGVPIQFLGVRWTRLRDGRRQRATDDTIRESVGRVLALRDPAAVPILLAHHPHAFDAAAAAQIPLTLSGHTHGGQLMLNERFGAGPAMFKYWSGLYRQGNSSLVVSNGAGNWFPLRINAPAEIVQITLRASDSDQ